MVNDAPGGIGRTMPSVQSKHGFTHRFLWESFSLSLAVVGTTPRKEVGNISLKNANVPCSLNVTDAFTRTLLELQGDFG